MFLLWLACSAPLPTPCEEMSAGIDQDICFSKRMGAIPDPEQAAQNAQGIADPVVRGAAVMRWIEANNKAWNPQQVMPLCETLDGRDKGACHRRVLSAHLNR